MYTPDKIKICIDIMKIFLGMIQKLLSTEIILDAIFQHFQTARNKLTVHTKKITFFNPGL